MRTLEFKDGALILIDQTKLPHEEIYVVCKTYQEVGRAIVDMIVRGAPAIGITAAYGVVIGAASINTESKADFFNKLEEVCEYLKRTRPTAVNLFWAIDRIYNKAKTLKDCSIEKLKELILAQARLMEEEDIATNRSIGLNGHKLIQKKGATILTHCNAGALAVVDYGTAIGVIRASFENGNDIQVYATETRPYLQGARLTSFELKKLGIPVTLICDNMAGYFMNKGLIDYVVVGADRITSNGDVANKIGTYTLAVLAHENNIPFYVAAPYSTIDLTLKNGSEIIIEERDPKEITHIKGIEIPPRGINVKNPAFDVTPNKYITAIITERGILYSPSDILKYSLQEN